MLLIGRRYLSSEKKILGFRGNLLTSAYKSNLVFRQWVPIGKAVKLKIGMKLKVIQEEMYHSPNILSQLNSRIYCEMLSNKKGHITQHSIASIIPDNPPQLRNLTSTKQLLIPIQKPRIIVDIFTDASIKYVEGFEETVFEITKV